MKLSAFTPLGLLRLSGETPAAERFYRTLNAGLGGELSTEEGSFADALHFAAARAFARAQRDQRRAALQGIPRHTTGLLPVFEREKGLVPGPDATMADRRAALAARTLLPAGSTLVNVESALRELLGADFIALRPTTISETVVISQADGGDVLYARPDVARKIIRLDAPMVHPNAGEQAFAYSPISTSSGPLSTAPSTPLPGERFVLEPGNLGRAEVIVLADVLEAPPRLVVKYGKSHDAGVLGFSQAMPSEATTKRHSLVIVTAAAAQHAEKRRQVHELLRRMVRDVSTWDVVADSGAGATQQFQIGLPSIGIAHATPVAFP